MISVYYKFLLVILLAIFAGNSQVMAAGVVQQQKTDFSISLGAEFASGKYGTATATQSVYLPLVVTWFPTERIDVGVEIPYIYQNNRNVTTSLYHSSQTSTAAQVGTARFGGGPGGSSSTTVTGSSTATSSVSGLGDIIMRLGVIALFEGKNIPQLRPSLVLKFPTANSEDGLGTGEFDAGAGLEATKWFGKLQLSGEAIYNYQGRVDGFALKNYLSYTVGLGYQATENVRPIILLKGSTALSGYTGDLMESRLRLLWDITRTTGLDLFLSYGIADSSPDYSGGIAVVYSF